MKTLVTGDAALDVVLNPPTVAAETVLDALIVHVRDGILKLNLPCYGGVPVTVEQATERARNIVAGLVCEYPELTEREGQS